MRIIASTYPRHVFGCDGSLALMRRLDAGERKSIPFVCVQTAHTEP